MRFVVNIKIAGRHAVFYFLSCLSLMLTNLVSASQSPTHFTLATAQLPPYVFIDKHGQITGLLIDKLTHAQQHSGLNIEVLVMPWGRALNEVKNNRIDAIMPALWSQQRSEYLAFLTQVFYTLAPSVIIKRATDNFEFNGLANIPKDKVIGKARLVMLGQLFDKMVEEGQLTVYPTNQLDEALLMLKQNKVELVASEGGIALSTIKKLGLEGQFTLYSIEKNVPASYIAFSKDFAKSHDINTIMAKINQHSAPSLRKHLIN